jgi:hypothetical protein
MVAVNNLRLYTQLQSYEARVCHVLRARPSVLRKRLHNNQEQDAEPVETDVQTGWEEELPQPDPADQRNEVISSV